MADRPVFGKDVFLTLLEDGQEVDTVSIVNFEETEEAEIIRHDWLGQVVTRRSKVHMGFSGTLEIENTDPGVEELIQRFYDNYRSGVIHPTVTITSQSHYINGDTAGFVYIGVVLSSTKTTSAKDEVQTIRLEWEAEERRPL